MIFFIIFGVVSIVCLVMYILTKGVAKDNKKWKTFKEICGYVSGWSGFVSFVCLAFFFGFSLNSLAANAELKTFYSEVFAAYKITAEKTERMTVGSGNHKNAETVLMKSEYLQQAPEAAKRWAELRDKLEWYNTTLRKRRSYYENWFCRHWFIEPPKDLPYIKMN